jgi:pilus assembly protein Flp/PilA
MLSFISKFASLKSDRRGVTALEYAVVAAVVIAAVVTAYGSFGSSLSAKIAGLTTFSTTSAGAFTGATVPTN